MQVTKQLRTETGHRLCDYSGRCAHFHGHSYLWEVTAEAETLTSNGMVTDFKDLKKAMVEVLDPLDHALVLYRNDDILIRIGHAGMTIPTFFEATDGSIPRLFLWDTNPTAESFARWAADEIQYWIDHNAKVQCDIVRVRVWETATSYAQWDK